MPVTRRACPTCHRSLRITRDLPARVKCPHCETGFAASPDLPTPRPPSAYPVAAPFAPPPEHNQEAGRARPWLFGVILAGVGLFVLLGIGLLVLCLTGGEPQSEEPKSAPALSRTAVVTPPKKGLPPVTGQEGLSQQKKGPDAGKVAAPGAGEEREREKIAPPEEETPELSVKVITSVTTEKVTRPRRLRLAVTPPKYDNMGELLKTLGDGYKYTALGEADLRSSPRLADFDVVFFTCSRTPLNDRALEQSLRAFVQSGGTLYASDLRFAALRGAFPEFIAAKVAEPGGATQEVTARVVDGGLCEALGGEKLRLKFEAFGWKPASFDRAKVTTFLEGWYKTGKNRKAFAPLLVSFRCGKGTVIFTSFHNAAQNSELEQKLLRYLVFTAVTAEVERKVETTLISGGFAPAAARRSVTSPEESKVTHTYTHKKGGPLRFVLGFANQGAKLRLTLVAPDGSTVSKEGTDTFTVEVANAPAGAWRYTVTALEVPFPNFPFTLTVGEPSKP